MAEKQNLTIASPELAGEWSEKNSGVTPDMFLPQSNTKVWWKCSAHGHEWQSRISDRYLGSGCPYCTGHLLMPGFNDLKTCYPKLAAEWSGENKKSPDSVFPKSRENVLWECHKCGYKWSAVIFSRVKGSKCPVCSGLKTVAGINDIATTDPDFLNEWDYGLNDIAPEQLSRHSKRFVWWKGKCGHSFRAKVMDRIIKNQCCRVCAKNFNQEHYDIIISKMIEAAGLTEADGDDSQIGVGLRHYIPSIRVSIEVAQRSHSSKKGYRREYVKNNLCRKAKIRLVRIMTSRDRTFEDCVCVIARRKSDKAFIEAVKGAFKVLRIKIADDFEIDTNILLKQYAEKQIGYLN